MTSPPHSTGSHSCRTPADQQLSRPYDSSPTPEQWNPAPPRDDTRALNLSTLRPRHENGPPTSSADRHETSRLSLGLIADQLPRSVAKGQGETVSDAIDTALARITWELTCLTDDLVTSFNGKGGSLPMHATAIRQCAAPLGLATHHLAKAIDQISSHHQCSAPATATQNEAPKDLLPGLQRDIEHARTAIYATANQYKTNASLLGNTPTTSPPTPK